MTPTSLRILRFAMISSTAMIAGAMVFLRSVGAVEDMSEALSYYFLYALVAIILFAGVGLVMVRRRLLLAKSFQQKGALAITAWALGEGPAMAGSVFYLLVGDFLQLLAGVMFAVMVFIIIPSPDGDT